MSKPKLYLTRILPEEVMDYISTKFELRFNMENRIATREELIEGIKWCDALLCLLSDKIDAELLSLNPNLKCVSNYAVGYNNIDVAAATRLGIAVCNTPGVLTESTADLAWALMFAVARRIAEGDAFTRAGLFEGWAPKLMQGYDVFGSTLGVIGAGRIGSAVARRASGFNMRVLYFNRSKKKIDNCEATQVGLDYLLKESDFISLNIPYTSETHHIINEKELSLMKRNAIIINTARGACINEVALVEALRKGLIAGAGLDVYEHEPEIMPELLTMQNVVLLPHIGSATYKTRKVMGLLAVENILDVLSGRIPQAIVNNEVLAKIN
ncbi:MAG: D-glycerate dehydrogenase [Candidatus Cloacimonetes bacterium]|nr:D-glycerate dehydrogenase [Candidatus Cloacimonadota bacterium]